MCVYISIPIATSVYTPPSRYLYIYMGRYTHIYISLSQQNRNSRNPWKKASSPRHALHQEEAPHQGLRVDLRPSQDHRRSPSGKHAAKRLHYGNLTGALYRLLSSLQGLPVRFQVSCPESTTPGFTHTHTPLVQGDYTNPLAVYIVFQGARKPSTAIGSQVTTRNSTGVGAGNCCSRLGRRLTPEERPQMAPCIHTAYMNTYVCIHLYTYLCACVRACKYVYTYKCVERCIFAHISIYDLAKKRAFRCTSTYAYLSKCIHLYIYIHIYTNICIYVNEYVSIYV